MPAPRALRAYTIFSALALLAACGGGGDSGGGKGGSGGAGQGGTAIVGILGNVQSFNPVTNTASTVQDIERYMLFTPLIQFDEKLQPRAYLAESWQMEGDTGVTMKLRRDVKWHDGQPVTAEDVKFTFDLAKNPKATSGLVGSVYLTQVKSATVVDPYTIRFAFTQPHAMALEDFWWSPVPKHILGNVPPEQLTQHPYNQKPIGSGPFKVGEFRPNQSLVLEANPAFPAGIGGRPKLDRVVFRMIPEATTLVTELLNGTADVIGWTLLPDQAAQVKSQQGYRLSNFPSREFYYVGWNNEREPFKDANVRRALGMAINKPQMIQGLLRGFGSPAHGVIPPWSPMHTDLSQADRYDPAAAKQLLAQAGWRDTNGDGIVEKNGRPLRFVLLTNSENQLRKDVASFVQQQLKQIGVDAQLRTIEFQTMLQQHKARDYDAIISGWVLDTFRVDPVALFSCAEAQKKGSPNRTGYCNPELDRLMDTGMRTNDPAAAKQTWTQFSQMLQRDQPLTTLFWIDDMAGIGRRIQNVTMDPRSKLVSVAQWTKNR
ncbi:MAG TPA: ABC transporter substrate-binding protein [Longimicrobium sp.]|jgi:peptide/nickel transport system substrate-binding protein